MPLVSPNTKGGEWSLFGPSLNDSIGKVIFGDKKRISKQYQFFRTPINEIRKKKNLTEIFFLIFFSF